MFDKSTLNNNDNRGAILLIALLIVSAITAVGLGMSVVIFNGLRSASAIDRSISATYASEAGLEWTLEQLAEARDTVSDLGTVIAAIQAEPTAILFNGATWNTNDSQALEDNLLQDIAKDQTIELDLFDPVLTTEGFGTTNKIAKLLVRAPSPNAGWAEIDWVAWDDGKFIGNSRTKVASPTELISGKTVDLTKTDDDPELDALIGGLDLEAFRVKVRARIGDLNDLTVEALDAGGAVISIPNRAYIKSEGRSGDATIALTTSIPWRLPTSPLFDFVIFSEESLEK